jgi:iron complex transport system substrate-binding protein
MKKYYSLLFIFVFLFLFSCKNDKIEFSAFKITDDVGKELSFDSIPKRIVSLAPSITESLFEIGASENVIAVTDFCNYPQETNSKIRVGGIIDPNIEVIASIKPDLILTTVEGNSKSAYQSLINLGYKVFASNPRNTDGIIKMLRDFGKITDKELNAKKLINKIDSTRKSYKDIQSKIAVKPKTVVLVSLNPLITVNSSTYINEIINLSGYNNIFADESLPYPVINGESVLLRNPEYIILISELADPSGEYLNTLNKYFSGTDALKNDKIIIIDSDILSRPGPRVLNAIDFLFSKK